MAFDLIRSSFSRIREIEVSSGSVVTAEGLVLVSVLEAGLEKVKVSTGAAAEQVLGFAITDNDDNAQKAAVESHTVPAAAPYTVTLDQAVPVASSSRIADLTAVADLVEGSAANVGEYEIAGNIVTFNAAEAGNSLEVSYRYNLTVAESRQKYYERNINRTASEFFNQVSVGTGEGIVFLDNFDATVNYDPASYGAGEGLIVLAGGLVSVGTVAGAQALPAHVIELPSVDKPMLGLAYTILN